jgi:hypothetical protein
MTITQETVDNTIAGLEAKSDDTLVHIFKCCSSLEKTADKKLVDPLVSAINQERKRRGTARTVTSRVSTVSLDEEEV